MERERHSYQNVKHLMAFPCDHLRKSPRIIFMIAESDYLVTKTFSKVIKIASTVNESKEY
jgi:hypothetical protein